MYKFGRASILQDLPPGTGIFEWVPYGIASREEGTAFVAKHGGNVVFGVKIVPVELARMLAKIAHSFAVAELGWGSFDPIPQNVDTILCRTDDVAYTVGGEMELSSPVPDAGHLTFASVWVRPFRSPMLIIDIRLFASIDTPNFHVAVGTLDLSKPRHLSIFREKINSTEIAGGQ
jgi:hypothetical protein